MNILKTFHYILPYLTLSSLINKVISKSNSIHLKYHTTQQGGLDIGILIGKQTKYIFKVIDQSIDYTWSSDIFYNVTNSSSAKVISKGNKTLYGYDIKSQVISETFEIGDTPLSLNKIELKNMSFLLVNDIENIYKRQMDSFGFAHKFGDERFSIVHQLYRNKYINTQKYFLYPNYDLADNGTFILGGNIYDILPFNPTFKNKGIININETARKWEFTVNKLKIGNNSYENSISTIPITGYFQAAEGYVYVPLPVLSFFNETIFKEALKTNHCSYKIFAKYHYYECINNVINNFPQIIITIDGNDFVINSNNFFERSKGRNYSTFYFKGLFNKNAIYDNFCYDKQKWIFGTPFLKLFISEFDYDKNKVTLYSNVEGRIKNNNLNFIRKIDNTKVIILNVLIGLFGIIVISLYIALHNKHIKRRRKIAKYLQHII